MNLIYPSNCEACGDELLGNEKIICVSCWHLMPRTMYHLQANNPVVQKFTGRIPVQFGTSMYYFNKDTRVQHVLHALKYKNKKEVGIQLGQRVGNELINSPPVKDIDLIIPIPLSKQKLRKRGYNQSDCIASGMSERLHIPIDTTSVIRRKNTQSQTTMTVGERIDNVKNAFEVIQVNALVKKHILLLDDVLTTGATLESCAKEILKLPGTRISILTLACAIE